MKQLTGFMPIAALPASTAASAKKQLLETIDWLQKEGAASVTNLKLINAITESILWSEKSYTRFLQCGFDAAIELFDISSQNWEFEESMSSRHNPRNWDEYKQLATCTNIVLTSA
ncbi:hypothetical protein FNW02_37380 [Komarekiella sp. 'clone 1']|uniref:Uncharacterized protein n=1 Tax=Komarekiella delphini-convector SJRDD-AB1 TaxID=2593771 RepID=A0AA41BAL2_9NOST|nr:hypothetical protein [Komarekiella delphini-convector]MBD6621221.1 hypothetical protein [Komarekiella delphini-convector SJRDD-AB1]